MAGDSKSTPGPFDVSTVREIISLMEKHGLSEVDLNSGDQRIRLRRGPRIATVDASAMMLPTAVAAVPSVPASAAPATPTAPAAPAAPAKKLLEIKSELVGNFFAKPAPDKDDYVKVGSRVSADTVVCKVEAMKIFNDITAKCSGTIVEVCVANGTFVEFDQVLFRVEPN